MSDRVLSDYYAAFNRGDSAAMLALLTDDVVHEPSQGAVRNGKAAFAEFLDHMNRCYSETVIEPVFLTSADGTRAANAPKWSFASKNPKAEDFIDVSMAIVRDDVSPKPKARAPQ